MVDATAKNGIEAVECQLALRQVEAHTALGTGEGKQTLILSKNVMNTFRAAFIVLRRTKMMLDVMNSI